MSMKSFFKNIVFFLIPVIIYLGLAWVGFKDALEKSYGPNTYDQITKQFEDVKAKKYDNIILGNSKLYRGLNPDFFTLSTYNFAHDSDAFNQMYYKLMYLQEEGISFENLILGIDLFQFAAMQPQRNYAYHDFFPKAYIEDFDDPGNLSYFFTRVDPQNFQKMRKDSKFKAYLKDNGQYIKDTPQKIYTDFSEETADLLPTQQLYFERILEVCYNNNIKVFLTMPHRLPLETQGFEKEEIKVFYDYVNGEITKYPNLVFLNYAKQIELFKAEDYTDNFHLKSEVANKFSTLVNNDISKHLKK